MRAHVRAYKRVCVCVCLYVRGCVSTEKLYSNQHLLFIKCITRELSDDRLAFAISSEAIEPAQRLELFISLDKTLIRSRTGSPRDKHFANSLIMGLE